MINLKKITRPSLILDEEKCRNNIRMMAKKAGLSRVSFRPHFKTHQSHTIGNWFREEGINAITVSSVTMARHFAAEGWDDITIAFPANIREAEEMKDISKHVTLNILISSPEHLDVIMNSYRFKAGCFFKVNTGMNRSGTEWDDREKFLRMIEETGKSKYLRIKGLLTHAGHTYKAQSKTEILKIYSETLDKMKSVRSIFDVDEAIISVGDTPSCSIVDDFTGVDEIRPGNFVFYDLTQCLLGSCDKDNVAVAVACPVVDKNDKRKEIIIYGGGVHLSKDKLVLPDGKSVFGLAVYLTGTGWTYPDKESWLRSISQEHGVISAEPDFYNDIKIGDIVGVIPVHSCMTADLLRVYHTTGERIINDFSPK